MKVDRKSRAAIILAATERRSARTISKGVDEGLREMKARVPVDEGHLESTCRKRDDRQGHAMLAAGGVSGIDPDVLVDYELPVEFGTATAAAQPFFRPGVETARRRIKRDMKVTDK